MPEKIEAKNAQIGFIVDTLTAHNVHHHTGSKSESNEKHASAKDEKPRCAEYNSCDIFISYSRDNAELSQIIGEFIEVSFPTIGSCFVSCNPDSITAGQNWIQSIEDAIRSAKMMIVIATVESLQKQWINFEIGAAWALGLPIVFICHGKQISSSLPMPYATRQSLKFSVDTLEDDLAQLVTQLEHVLQTPPRRPSFKRWSAMMGPHLQAEGVSCD